MYPPIDLQTIDRIQRDRRIRAEHRRLVKTITRTQTARSANGSGRPKHRLRRQPKPAFAS